MTNCREVYDVLIALSNMANVSASSSTMAELTSMGLVAPVEGGQLKGGAGGEMEEMKNRLADIANEKAQLREQMSGMETVNGKLMKFWQYSRFEKYKSDMARLEALELEERGLRSRVVDMVQGTDDDGGAGWINGNGMRLSFKGREVLEHLEQRMERIGGMELDAFLAEQDGLRAHFDERAARARQILAILGPRFSKMDEIHFRMASIGLAGRWGAPQEIADLFTAAYRPLPMVEGLDNSAEISLAETIAIRAASMQDVQATTQYAVNMLQSPWKGGWATDDQVRAIAIVLSIPGEAQAVIGRTIELAQTCTYNNLAAAALLTSSEAKWSMTGGGKAAAADPLSVYLEIYQRLYTSHPTPEVPVIASILTVSGMPAQKACDRFEKAFNVLENYNGGQMQVPAAMVAIMPFGVEEGLDNIRMASASVIKNKMTLGGMENLSLGLKMAMHSSIMASSDTYGGTDYAPLTTPPPSMMAIAGLTAAVALAMGAGLLAFHETYLHRKAVRDYTFHPVHRAYMYG